MTVFMVDTVIHNNFIHTKIFQSDRILTHCCETFTTYYTSRKTDLNLTIARATTNGLVLQIINSLIAVRLTWLHLG